MAIHPLRHRHHRHVPDRRTAGFRNGDSPDGPPRALLRGEGGGRKNTAGKTGSDGRRPAPRFGDRLFGEHSGERQPQLQHGPAGPGPDRPSGRSVHRGGQGEGRSVRSGQIFHGRPAAPPVVHVLLQPGRRVLLGQGHHWLLHPRLRIHPHLRNRGMDSPDPQGPQSPAPNKNQRRRQTVLVRHPRGGGNVCPAVPAGIQPDRTYLVFRLVQGRIL